MNLKLKTARVVRGRGDESEVEEVGVVKAGTREGHEDCVHEDIDVSCISHTFASTSEAVAGKRRLALNCFDEGLHVGEDGDLLLRGSKPARQVALTFIVDDAVALVPSPVLFLCWTGQESALDSLPPSAATHGTLRSSFLADPSGAFAKSLCDDQLASS